MKRIIIILYITLVLSLIGLFIYGNSKAINYKYYTIKENISLVYEKNRRMVFNIYSEANRPMIIYPEYNSYTLRLDTVSFTLENVKVNVYDGFDINLIKATIITIIIIPSMIKSAYSLFITFKSLLAILSY